MKSSIVVRTNFEGIHQYTNAPEEVDFLRYPHRHIFYVEAEIEVKHDDRELEFVIVKRAINRFLFGKPFTVQYSCEQMAKDIIGMLEEKFGERHITVGVYEDNENGGKVTNEH